uniref:Thiol methyltransferase 2 n=1 Tax=Vitis vinifera TaxID=29760 RepID=A5BNQ4_VITVI|nr:hypothetical protein VITISV_035654 [Vitis vinifera]
MASPDNTKPKARSSESVTGQRRGRRPSDRHWPCVGEESGSFYNTIADGERQYQHRIELRASKNKPSSWEEKWQQGLTPWDLGKATPIIEHLHQAGALPNGRTLIPGCGRGYDVVAIACPERFVVGLDISDSAIKKAKESSSSSWNASHFIFLKADFFTWNPTELFDLIIDYTFFCAIEPDMRPAWASRMQQLLKPDGELLTLMFPISDHTGGPPYKVSIADYEKVLHPMRFKAVSIVDNEMAIGSRKKKYPLKPDLSLFGFVDRPKRAYEARSEEFRISDWVCGWMGLCVPSGRISGGVCGLLSGRSLTWAKNLGVSTTQLRMSNNGSSIESNPKVQKLNQIIGSDSAGGWEKSWQQGHTPWDLGKPTPIIQHLHQTGTLPSGKTLVPGCGCGYDVVTIACPERFVVGLDISDSAIKKAKEISDHAGGPPYKVSVADYEEVLHPMGFKAVSIVDNKMAIGPRKGREKLGRWKRTPSKSLL